MICIPKLGILEAHLGVLLEAPKDDSAAAVLVQEIIVNNPVLDLVVVMDLLDLAVMEVN